MMSPRRTPRRACRDHGREWKGFCVDNGLEDGWLVSLNDLAAFDLISICEGHCDRCTDSPMTPLHVKLRLKERLLAGIARRWDEHKMAGCEPDGTTEQEGGTDHLDCTDQLAGELEGFIRGTRIMIARGLEREQRPMARWTLGTLCSLPAAAPRLWFVPRLLSRVWSARVG